MGSPQQQAATAIANLLGRVGRFAVVVGIGGGIAQSSLYTGDPTLWISLAGFDGVLLGMSSLITPLTP